LGKISSGDRKRRISATISDGKCENMRSLILFNGRERS
jgi:hypothetical protein